VGVVFDSGVANRTILSVTIVAGQNTVTDSKEFLLYNEGSLLADVGGLMGMFLGASLLTAFDACVTFGGKFIEGKRKRANKVGTV